MLNIDSKEFEPIFSDIKNRYLSSTNLPKLIVGTGLSIAMNIPGMSKLKLKLEEEFESTTDDDLKKYWYKYKEKINDKGLEAGLADISPSEEIFLEKIREVTSEFILDEEYKQHDNILNKKSGFEKLLKYLLGTVSVNSKILDIMTPNYDRIIELICDKIKVSVTLGFSGNVYQTFDSNVLKKPHEYFFKKTSIVRLFKPHGSVNWVKKDEKEYQINDYNFLKMNKQHIDIITPGNMKYKMGLTNEIFRLQREIFNELITDPKKNYSIFIYGYGFNDKHFNTVFENTQRDIIVLTKSIEKSFLERAIKNKNWTLFYSDGEEQQNFMVYRGEKYIIDKELWDINVFSETFLG